MPHWLDPLFRWTHVIAGITWIGLLYFFNWVNGPFAATLDAESKKKVVPELLPRALYWFRWGAAWTWITGVLLLSIVFYHGRYVFEGLESNWSVATIIMIVLTFFGVHIYDVLVKTVLTDPKLQFFGGWILASGVVYLYRLWPGWSLRGMAIHFGVMFGTFMAFNVWFRIWPAQKKIIAAIKNGEAPDGDLAKLAGTRSKHNTYMSIPLVAAMLNMHMVTWLDQPWKWTLVILVGWSVCWYLYGLSKKVKGF